MTTNLKKMKWDFDVDKKEEKAAIQDETIPEKAMDKLVLGISVADTLLKKMNLMAERMGMVDGISPALQSEFMDAQSKATVHVYI